MIVVPIVIAAIRIRPPTISQLIGPPRAKILRSAGALAFLIVVLAAEILRRERGVNLCYDSEMEATLASWVNVGLNRRDHSKVVAGRKSRQQGSGAIMARLAARFFEQ